MANRPQAKQLHTMRPRASAMVAALLAVACDGCREPKAPAPRPPQVEINGRQWNVEIADTTRLRWIGLSYRARLAPNAGMLFVYPRPAVMDFCMRACEIPLDIAFIDSDRRVVKTYTMKVEPDRLGKVRYSSGQPVQFALEVGAGELARAGVRVGQQVHLLGEMPDPAKAEP